MIRGLATSDETVRTVETFAAALGLGAISAEPDGNMVSGWGLALTALFTVISMVAIYMLGGYIAGAGTVTALQTATVRPRVDGLLTRIRFTEGQAVLSVVKIGEPNSCG